MRGMLINYSPELKEIICIPSIAEERLTLY